jgi:outer membrane protein, heavy metal efflux system
MISLFLTAVILAAASPASAGERKYDLRQVVEFTLQNNGELKALRDEKGIREAGRIKAGLYPNPVLELDGTTGKLTGSQSENSISAGISLELPTMGKRGKRLKVAAQELESFDHQVDNSARLLIVEVKTTFYEMLLAEKRLELAEHSISLNNQFVEITRQRFEAGDVPELEVNLAQVEAARSEGRKVEAERDLYPAKARLLALMGLTQTESASFSGSLQGKDFTKNLEELKALALSRRPDLKALEAEQAKADAEIALARAERIPNVTVGLGYQWENSSIDVAGDEIKSRDNLIGVKLSIPLAVFDRNQAGILEAKARRQSADNRYGFALKVVEREVEAAVAQLSAAGKAVAIYEKTILPQLGENLKLVQEAYRLGEVGILTVIEEQKKFFEVNDGYLATLYGNRTAVIKLEAAVGTILE